MMTLSQGTYSRKEMKSSFSTLQNSKLFRIFYSGLCHFHHELIKISILRNAQIQKQYISLHIFFLGNRGAFTEYCKAVAREREGMGKTSKPLHDSSK